MSACLVETIGDAYMVVSGLPTHDPLHAQKVANFAVVVSRVVSAVKSPLDGKVLCVCVCV